MSNLSKICTRCNTYKSLSEFRIRTEYARSFKSWCKPCEREGARKIHTIKDLLQLVNLFIFANRMEGERFLSLKRFKNRFWISDFGRIISCNKRTGEINFLRPSIDGAGYYNSQLRKKPVSIRIRYHNVVADHFIKRIPGKNWINHKNGIKLDNHFENLEWVTPAENCGHAVITGLQDVKGEKHPHAKLTKDKVHIIRALAKTGMRQKDIGEIFGICRRQAGDIINRVNWGWLEDLSTAYKVPHSLSSDTVREPAS